ncbi:MAG: type II restriction endonuclease [Fibrobacter sp.]|nr:type II restriction endonuclease [Fibrobacter sp.]
MSFTINETWALLSSLESDIKKKIEEASVPLSHLSLNIFRGVLTGFNTAFIISESKRNELVNSDPKSAEIIRPILRGRDVKRYEFDFSRLWLISTFPSLNIDIDRYPAIKNHLLSFGYERLEQSGRSHIINGERVKSRKKTNNKWFETQDSISYWDEFSKQKIIWKRIGSLIRFAYDDEGYLGLDSTCMATGNHIKFVSAFLNSVVGNHILSGSPKTGTGDLLISVQALDPIRIPLEAENDCLPIIETIHAKSKTKQAFHEEEMELDTVLFDYYGFTSKERDFLRKSTAIYR